MRMFELLDPLDPRVDVIFKRIFGSERNKDVLSADDEGADAEKSDGYAGVSKPGSGSSNGL